VSDWLPLFEKPDNLEQTESVANWFARIASQLLGGVRLVVGGQPYRLVEIEFYYYCDNIHPDPFTHCDPLQRECGRWYFHRTRGSYRGGTYKGLDITFGDSKAFGGILIRSIEAQDGTLFDGPSLCVDRLLMQVGVSDVAVLDGRIGSRLVWDADSPLVVDRAIGASRRVQRAIASEPHHIFTSPRVGLSLKKAKKSADMPRYILLPYRYLTEPRRISKGKLYLVLALHVQGVSQDVIHKLTGSPRHTIGGYIADFEAGCQHREFAPYFGIDLKPKDLCRLYGTWQANYSGS
jgi:hypothetical protein